MPETLIAELGLGWDHWAALVREPKQHRADHAALHSVDAHALEVVHVDEQVLGVVAGAPRAGELKVYESS